MDMVKFFHMNGGTGDASYSSNSELQRTGIMKTQGIIEKAIGDLRFNNKFPETLVMADLGCSCGPNTLLVGSIVTEAVAKISLEMGVKPPEVQINLNDLPTNDFNTIFIALEEVLQGNSTIEKRSEVHLQPASCYFTGVPGSFFGRLFPMKTLHFVHSSYSVQWLSQLPTLKEVNKGNIYLSSTTPESVSQAYYEQFQKDFLGFLRCRSEEMIAGGRMILTLSGRTTDDRCGEESYYLWRPLAMALQDMVYEGLIDEAKLDSFNLPQYTASPSEIKNLVEKQGSFTVDHLTTFDINWEVWKTKKYESDASQNKEIDNCDVGHYVAKAVRAAIESLVAKHFGEEIVDDVFTRYEKNLTNRNPRKENESFVTITLSLIRKM